MTRPDPQPWTRAQRAGALGLVVALVLGCTSQAENPIRSVSRDEIASSLGSERPPLLLDVRTPAEFAEGHLPGALPIPVAELPGRLAELRQASRGREIVVYCERGGRAQRAAQTLLDAGFEKVGHLEGDMRAWRAENLPIRH
jgi:rhodanese-related sulfurtransferase